MLFIHPSVAFTFPKQTRISGFLFAARSMTQAKFNKSLDQNITCRYLCKFLLLRIDFHHNSDGKSRALEAFCVVVFEDVPLYRIPHTKSAVILEKHVNYKVLLMSLTQNCSCMLVIILTLSCTSLEFLPARHPM